MYTCSGRGKSLTDDERLVCEAPDCMASLCTDCGVVVTTEGGGCEVRCPICTEPTVTNLTVLVREERRKPYQLILIFPLDSANLGMTTYWGALYDGECPFNTYCHGEANWSWIHDKTRPCRDEGRVKEILDYYAQHYAEPKETITFTVRERITNDEKLKAWGMTK